LTNGKPDVISINIERKNRAIHCENLGDALVQLERCRTARGMLPRLLRPLGQFPLMDLQAAVVALGALAQEHRLALFRLLVQAGEDGMPAGAIAEKLGVPNSSLSFHLAQLRGAGLITQERQHRSLIYRANYPAMNTLIDYLTENCCAGADCSSAAKLQKQRKTA
jgi:DNA-binding transcriptional ArsR family regulator